jgi:hypothetical protein
MLTAALRAWAGVSSGQRARSGRLAKAVRKMMQGSAAAAYSRWFDEASTRAGHSRVVSNFASVHFNRIGGRAVLAAWSGHVSASQAWRRKVGNLFLRATAATGAMFAHWQRFAAACAVDASRLRRAAARMRSREAAAAYSTWWVEVSRLRAMRSKASTVMHRWNNSSLSMAMAAWWDSAQARSGARRVMQRWVSRLENAAIFDGLRSWVAGAAYFGKTEQTMKRVSARILHRTSFQAFGAWFDAACALKSERMQSDHLKARAMAKFRNRSVSGAYDRWFQAAHDARKQSRSVQRIVARWKLSSARQCLEAWAVDVAWMVRLRCMMLAVVDKSVRNVKAGFLEWKGLVHSQGEVESRMLRIAKRMLNQQLASAYSAWGEASVEMARRKGVLSRIAVRMKNHGVFVAWSTWSETAQLIASVKRLTAKIALRWSHRVESSSFGSWTDFVEIKLGIRQSVEMLFMRSWHAQARCGVDAWRKHSAHVQRTEHTMRRFAAKLHNRCASLALVRWSEYCDEAKQQRLLMSRATSRLANSSLHSAYDRWYGASASIKQQQHALRSVLTRWDSSCKQAHFDLWVAGVAWQTHLRQMFEEAMDGNLRLLRGGFVAWIEGAAKLCSDQAKLARISARMLHRTSFQAFAQWRSKTEETVDERDRVNRTLASVSRRWRHACVDSCFKSWNEFRQIALEQRALMQRVGRLWSQGAASKAFRAIQDLRTESRAKGEAMRRVVGRMRSATLHRTFAALNENWCLRAVVQSRLRTMLAQWSGSSLLAAVLQWKNFTTVLEMTKQRVPRAELVILGRRVDELEAELNHCEAERRALQATLQVVGRERDLMTPAFEEERLRLQTRINDAMFLATKSSWIQRN